jgi:hypothetical protein
MDKSVGKIDKYIDTYHNRTIYYFRWKNNRFEVIVHPNDNSTTLYQVLEMNSENIYWLINKKLLVLNKIILPLDENNLTEVMEKFEKLLLLK